jgi:hypothetical protein
MTLVAVQPTLPPNPSVWTCPAMQEWLALTKDQTATLYPAVLGDLFAPRPC